MATTHISGLSGSGLDIDQLVKDAMKAQRARYDTLYQKKTQLEWKKTAYNDMYKAINDFRNNTVFSYKLDSTLDPKTVSTSNDSIISVTAGSEAASVNHTLVVDNMAEGVNLISNKALGSSTDKTTLASQFGLAPGTKFTLTLNNGTASKEITVDADKSIYEFISDVNNAGVNIKANYDTTLDRFFLSTTNTGSAGGIDFSGSSAQGLQFLNDKLKISTTVDSLSSMASVGTGLESTSLATAFGISGSIVFNLNGKTPVVFNDTDTVQDMVNKINGMGAGATAAYNTSTGIFSLTADSGKTLDLSQNSQGTLAFLKGNLNLPSVLKQYKGQDAKITLDGVDFTENSNTFSIAGLTYTLKGENPGTPITIGVHDDIDKTVDNVKKFIDAYNKMLDKVNTAIDDPVYRDFLPLTSDQKSAMKDSDITLWEQKAKSGLLHNDPTLQNLAYGMRDILSSSVSGLSSVYKNAASLGITTGLYTEKGKLYLDDVGEAQLRKALQADPEAVKKVFGAKSDDVSQQGIALRLYDSLKDAADKIVTTAGVTSSTTYDTQSTLAKEIKDYDDRMYDMNRRLNDMEDRYYKQFSALETALGNMNKQSSWLSQQFSS